MNIIYISPISWDNSGGAHRPVQFAQELARRGHLVTYIEIAKSRTPVPGENPRVLNFPDFGWDELELVRAWYGFDYHAPAQAADNLLEMLPPLQDRGIIICSAPFRPALELLPGLCAAGYTLVYDVLDDVSEMRALGTYCYDEIAETYLAANSALVVTLSPRLYQKFRARKNTVLIRDGVDLAPFRQAQMSSMERTPLRPVTRYRIEPESLSMRSAVPSKLARGELTLGFWGTMYDYNLDVPLLQTLTRARRQWEWHFIGEYHLDPARPSLAAALGAPNVHFHPSVTRETLAQYAQSFDVCILPTPVTPFNLARDPLKVYEYLACYKPVVSTNLEQLADMPHVYLSYDAHEFIKHVERAARTRIDHAPLDAYLQQQTWVKRTDALLEALEKLSPPTRVLPPPPHGAMPGASKEMDRWQAFAQHLERMVGDRERHIDALERALKESSIPDKFRRALKRN